MRSKGWISLIVPLRKAGGILFCGIFLLTQLFPCVVSAKENQINPGSLYALSAAVMDGENGRLLYGKEADVHRANASTTKILTCILCLENGNLQDYVAVSEYAAGMPDVQLNICEGEYYKMEDLLYSLMLESHNDSAVALAEHIGGSVEGFSNLMNEKAAELGCNDSYFLTPNGLDKKKGKNFHGTTAYDLGKIMKYCAWDSPQSDKFLQITQTGEHSFTNYEKKEKNSFVKGSKTFSCRNHNAFLQQNRNCISGKTGFTSQAGYCYVAAVESEGRKYTLALLGCGWPNNKTYKWKDCEKLCSYIDGNYHYRQVPDITSKLASVWIKDDENNNFDLNHKTYVRPRVKQKITKILLADWEKLDFKVNYPTSISATKKGTQTIGKFQMLVGNHTISTQPIKIDCPFGRRGLDWYFGTIARMWAGT